jgi:ABC-2 type transport system ATP-binding protein
MAINKSKKAIEVFDLTKKFGQLTAVNNISFQVYEGEVFGFLGPNGAGKTTTIRILTALTKPTKGTAEIFGHDLAKDTIKAKKLMGIVPEDSNVYGDLSAWENLIFTANLYQIGKRQAEEKAEELLKTFKLYNRKDDKAKGFSKGMRRRLAIAMGLVSSPRLLFLDEPTSGLDVESSLIIKEIISDLSKQKTTIFLTTHDIEEANKSCDRVAIINRGKIAAIDTPEKLKKTIQSVQSIEVAFNKNVSLQNISSLDEFPFINKIEKLGDKYRLFTNTPSKALSALWNFATKKKLKITSLNTVGPHLEEVFIKLTKDK